MVIRPRRTLLGLALLALVVLVTAAPVMQALLDSNIIFSDITTGDVSSTKHGFMKKLTGSAADFFDGAGNWVATVVETNQGNTYTTGAQDLGAATSLIVPKAGGSAPTADGDVRYDTTQDAIVAGGSGALTGKIPRVLSVQLGSSDTVTASVVSTTETDFATVFSLPANFYAAAGKTIVILAEFQYTSSSSPPTLQLRQKYGATVVFSTVGLLPAASQTNRGMGFFLTATAAAAPGASVNIETGIPSMFFYSNANGGNATPQPIANATNGALVATWSAQYSANTAGNSVTLRKLIVVELN